MEGNERRPHRPGTTEVRAALRDELEARGFDAAGDSHGLRSGLYIVGDNDLARALFEFPGTAEEAFESMYQGRWVDGLPPRFAVLPSGEADSASLEMLEQIRVVPVFFEVRDGAIVFPGLDEVLGEHV